MCSLFFTLKNSSIQTGETVLMRTIQVKHGTDSLTKLVAVLFIIVDNCAIWLHHKALTTFSFSNTTLTKRPKQKKRVKKREQKIFANSGG